MYLTEEHIKNVKLIFDSENESINSTEFIDENGNPHPQPTLLIDELLELDLIEVESDNKLVFLTPLGYEVAEGEWETQTDASHERRTLQAKDILKFANQLGVKKTKKYVFIALFLFAFLAALYAHFYSGDSNNKSPDLDAIFTEKVIDQIKDTSNSLRRVQE